MNPQVKKAGKNMTSLMPNHASAGREKEVASLKVIAGAQRTGEDLHQTQLRIVKGIREIFEADGALLVLFDEEDQSLVIKKQLGEDDDWKMQTSQKMALGLIADSILNGQCIAMSNIFSYPNFNPEFDGIVGETTRSYLCAPLTSNGVSFGALALNNPLEKMLTDDRIELFQMLSTALANAIYNSRLFMQLKVSSADLEASRWELLNSRNTLRALFDNLPSSIYIVDSNYMIMAVNMSRVRRQQATPNQLVGRRCYEKLYNRITPCPDCRVSETFASGQSTSRISREQFESGEYVEWEIDTFPIYNGASKPVQTIITEYDVTEKRLLEADLIQSEKMAAIGQLAAGMAHEIYNPLTAIIANAQMIRRMLPTVDEDIYESLELIEHAGVRASQVIRGLLSAARKEDTDSDLIDLNQSIENTLSLLSHEIIRRPIVLHKELQQGMPQFVANQNHLQGVWTNLIMNALDAIDQKEGSVTITTSYANSEYTIIIADTGKGIPKSQLARIFEPFFTTKMQGRGTGLGLSVCARVIKQHGGKITVESQPEKGTKFTIVLPEKQEA